MTDLEKLEKRLAKKAEEYLMLAKTSNGLNTTLNAAVGLTLVEIASEIRAIIKGE